MSSITAQKYQNYTKDQLLSLDSKILNQLRNEMGD
jgi:hypothetical protein